MNRNLCYATLWRVQRCPNQLFKCYSLKRIYESDRPNLQLLREVADLRRFLTNKIPVGAGLASKRRSTAKILAKPAPI
jgi:hypothetical protein